MTTARSAKNFIVPEGIESTKSRGTRLMLRARPPTIPANNDATVATCAGIENRRAMTPFDENSTTKGAFF